MAPLPWRALLCAWLCRGAAAKGCFDPGVEVLMADGQARRLADVRPGEAVLSWDEAGQRQAASIVKAAPAYFRPVTELVEVSLAHAVFHATEDHPFWSRGRGSLVSVDPNKTMAEYGLQAGAFFSEAEELEGVGATAVPANWRRPSAPVSLRGRRLGAVGAEEVEVQTLCLEPFHWFYVHGVRVHNKGCFVKTAEVSLPDGARRQIQHIREGDEVVSWDESRQQVAKSTVMVARTYLRSVADLVEITLPHAKLHATEDHPFWSRSQQKLVSVRPNRTMEEYKLAANILGAGEELEDEHLQGIHVSDVRRLPEQLAAQLLHTRRLEGGNGSGSLGEVEVMTLCLHPHHWFYVHGVRVHNKGCFAPWVRVLLSNGSQVPISAVRPDDRVSSWDADHGRAVDATVLGVDTFAPGEMFEMSLSGATHDPSRSSLRQLAGGRGRGLVFTADHPVYSARLQGVVSMRPNMTLASYGIVAGQMLEEELVRHHLGHDVTASVQPWRGESPSVVMTLQLDQYHWFYAEGVRVHNKGGFSSGGSSGGSSITWRSRSYFHNDLSYAGFILSTHTRRRRGVWASGGGCTYSADSGTSMTVFALSTCESTIGNRMACQRCDNCPDQSCVSTIQGCSAFLSRLYSECSESDNSGYIVLLGMFGVFIAYCCFSCNGNKAASASLQPRIDRRAELSTRAVNGQGLSSARWSGTYSENGETNPTSYEWTADGFGNIRGSSTDDDGTATVTGVMSWPAGSETGQIAWQEVRPGVTIEAEGCIQFDNQPSGPSSFWSGSPKVLLLQASYDSTTGVGGSVSLRSTSALFGQSVEMAPLAQQRQEEQAPLMNYGQQQQQQAPPMNYGQQQQAPLMNHAQGGW